ncbi:amino acid adenylation domain-containing protein [Plectonema cf. radiosum LEGE 06105]|uniref:Amino acid adenylation domain-containing protein n=1 Tax=Plectonema cf. radiosum LEGE 06105 TaxID=945769 RepID=A0A8J7EZM0_9CYAN|nr:non-ribosomal peptide synthetase [Plectonema radiosum]MBE9212893.1 amino acid adenylation domain-containing protein [Plectonema cf. radiosum LEGE 06105]
MSKSLENLSPEQKRQLLAKLLQEKANKPQNFPLSFAQKRLWFLDKLQPESSAYNIPAALHLTGSVNIILLQQSLNQIIQRHEVLRSSFTVVEEEPIQQVYPKLKLKFPLIDLQLLPNQQQEQQVKQLIKKTSIQPFDLSDKPLFRVKLIKLNSEEYVLLFTMHHIISDYFSMRLLIRELATIYQSLSKGETAQLPELTVQYGDYATWEQKWLKSPKRDIQLKYWQKNLANYPPLLALPTDYPRPPVQRFRGAREFFALSQDLSKALKNLSQGQNTTLFMTLLAAFKILLYRYSNQEDILIGSTITNRENQAEISNLIGLFVNNLIFRTNLSGNPSFDDFLQQVRNVTLNAYANQDLPYEYLVEQLQPERNLSYNPLFQVMFILHNTPTQTINLSGLSLKYLEPEHETSRFDLSLDMYETASGLTGIFEYNTDLFAKSTIERIIGHFQILLTAIVTKPEQKICQLPLLTLGEQQQLLIEWNNTNREYSPICLHQLIENQVELTPSKIAVVFESQQLTYKELNEKANQLAHYLKSIGVKTQTKVGIYLQRSEKILITLLAILKAGGTYIPLDPAFPQERLIYMIENSGVNFLITDSKTSPLTEIQRKTLINLDCDRELIEQKSHSNLAPQTTPNHLAYIIYTSGSTGKPKAVQILHKSLVNCLESMQQQPGITSDDILLSVTTLSFDIAALELYLPLITGARLIIASRETTTDGILLAQSIENNQVTIMQATPATWRLLLTAGWEGSQNLKILSGGEALDRLIAAELVKRGKELWNLYGPTEATIWSSVIQITGDFINDCVAIGKPINNTQFYVVDDDLQPVPIGVAGQLYIGGVGLASGYLNQPELTAERFVDNWFSIEEVGLINRRDAESAEERGEREIHDSKLYKTGDLVRYLHDGNLEYLGRIDYQVKLRGFRIELGEIEAVLMQHPQVNQAVVTLYDNQDDEKLIAYLIAEEEVSITQLRQFLQSKLPGYMIPSDYMMLEEFPLTPNRKVDRKALPLPEQIDIQEKRNLIAARNPIEELLVNIWLQILGVERISVDDNFFELGGHSLLATRVISQIREVFAVELPLRILFENPTIIGIAEAITTSKLEFIQPKIEKIERQNKLPISFAQQRQWFLSELEPDSPFYNIPAALQISGELDILVLEASFQEIINRHEVLRTAFFTVEGKPVAQLLSINEFQLQIIDLTNLTELIQQEKVKLIATEEAQEPFQLDKPPLLRVKLLRLNSQSHVILITLHHIIADGWSMGVLVKEVALIYQEETSPRPDGHPSPYQGEGKGVRLNELPIQYADFAAWQRNLLQGEVRKKQLNYWHNQLQNAPNLLELPTDFPRGAVQTTRGGSIKFELSVELSQALKQLSQKSGCTLFMTLLAAFQTLLYRYSNSEDIVIGSAIANRHRAELEGLIGCFANTLALRTSLSGNPTFEELLNRVREVALGAYAHQDLPFEQLIDELQLVRSLSYTPLFQVMFLLQNASIQPLILEDLSWSPINSDNGTAKFDLTLSMSETANGLIGSFEYNQDLFKVSTIERMIGHWQTLLQAIVENPQQKLYELPLLTVSEQQQLLVEWNQTQVNYPQSSIDQLFEIQVEKIPDSIAIVDENQQLTYQELNIRSNQLANYLIKLGVKPETRVGICVERRINMVIGLLAILKAGGAYVPLDPKYPQERLSYMLKDAEVSVLIQNSDFEISNSESLNVVHFKSDWNIITQQNTTNINLKIEPENLAYVIYTSGSTGKPKGVAITHRSATILIHWSRDVFTDKQLAGVLASTSICFDLSVFELFVPLSWGGKVILAENALQLPYLNTANSVTLINTVPSAILQLSQLKAIPNSVNTINLAGEALQQSLVQQLQQHDHIENIYNLYGPSEDTTYSTYALVSGDREQGAGSREQGDKETRRQGEKELITNYQLPITNYQSPPIGSAIANTQTYILDSYLQPVPIGIPGELYLGGDGLMRGYLNRAELTAEKLIPNPFFEEKTSPPSPLLSKERGVSSSPLLDKERGVSSSPLLDKERGVRQDGVRFLDKRLYKTGDKARYLSNGNIEYLGRFDNQVKIRGFRIELGEIESALNQHPEVNQAVTKVWEDTFVNKRLVAYFVLTNPVNENNFLTQLRHFLQNKLPDYMIPAIFMMLEEMPLTPNGKINRRALPEPNISNNQNNNSNNKNINHAEARTQQEQILTQIWSQLLGIESIGIHDNFFELGGDSILAIQVIAKASQAGLRLLPKQLFQYQTIAELAAVADTVSVNAEQGIITGIVPLTPIQHWFFAQNLADSHHWNQSIMLEVDKSISFTYIEQSIQTLFAHHDALRLQFRNIEQTTEFGLQQINADVDNYINKQTPLLQFDLSALNEKQQQSTITTTATQLQTSLDLTTGLVRVAFFKLNNHNINNNTNRLLFIIHHLVIDGISWRILLSDLQTIFTQLTSHQKIQLPPKTTSFQYWAKSLQNYAQSQISSSTVKYWQNVCKSPANSLPLDYSVENNTVATTNTVSITFTVEETQALLQQVPLSYQTQINDVLLTALVQTFEKWTGEKRLLIDLEAHGREDLFNEVDISRTVGWFTTMFPVWLDLSTVKDAQKQTISALKTIKEQLRQIPNRGIDYGILRYLGNQEIQTQLSAISPQIRFNYFGQVDGVFAESTLIKPATESTGTVRSKRGKRDILLEINSIISGGQLRLDWIYSQAVHRRSTIINLSELYLSALRNLIQLCCDEIGGYTPSDFPQMQLSQDELDDILEDL